MIAEFNLSMFKDLELEIFTGIVKYKYLYFIVIILFSRYTCTIVSPHFAKCYL